MSDDEDAMMNGVARDVDDKDTKHSSTSDDDDSSSSSSGSSSSSDSSDSESDGEGESREQQRSDERGRKYSTESVASSNGRALSESSIRSGGAAEPLTDVNSNRAAARFREQNSEVGLMALGTKKRDRRTIEEIQRDLQKKRSRAGSSLLGSSNGAGSKPFAGSAAAAAGSARASPPKGSPALSPEPPGSSDSSQLAVGLPQIKMPKGKPNSARSRLTMKILGRGRPNPVPPAKPAVIKKPASAAATFGAAAAGSGGSAGIVTNISAGAKASKALSNDLDSYVAEQRTADAPRQLEPRIEPKIIDWKPDGKVVRSILRSMLRFGDLTDVGMCASQRESFADEHRLANFIVRSNLPATTKVSEDKLLKTAVEIAERVQRAIEDKQDTMKYADVEVKPSQIIERLYENLKLRVAVQRALREARYTKNDDKGAYVLVAKQADLPTLGIGREFPPWSWAEKEHDWTSRKDTALLLGIYVHGFGAWEDILNDDLLHFHQQRALKGERMKKRAENLLKRLPPPDADVGDLRVVGLASALAAASQTPGQSIGAVFNAIIHNSNTGGGAGGSGGTGVVAVVANSLNKGRMQRAAERFAARQGAGSSGMTSSQRSVPEDSIRRVHTQSSSGGHANSSISSSSADRHRKPSITSPAISLTAGSSSSLSAPTGGVTVAMSRSDNEPEDGEVDATAPVPSSSSSAKRAAAASSSSSSSSKAATKRSASIEREAKSSSESARKRSKSSAERSARKSKKSKPPVLSAEACLEKWKPDKKLKDIHTMLKKMKVMESWSKDKKNEVVVEKMYKYVTTIGSTIDATVRQAERDGERTDPHEWDELCSCLWAYAASYTPFSSVTFERLYDDICADGESLRQAAAGGATGADASRRPSAAST